MSSETTFLFLPAMPIPLCQWPSCRMRIGFVTARSFFLLPEDCASGSAVAGPYFQRKTNKLIYASWHTIEIQALKNDHPVLQQLAVYCAVTVEHFYGQIIYADKFYAYPRQVIGTVF